ncbi:MAG: hypothetical protein HY040_18035 [Planctomycetes bacterium]|nr:hypothetical protein [Planctomycetota bacterium]
MNVLFRTPQRKSTSRFRPTLEALEARDCPSGNGGGYGGGASPPTITLQVQNLDQNTIVLSGRVTDASPGGLTVKFGGVYAGTCVTNADGTFSKTVAAASVGTESAVTKDSASLVSNVALAQVHSNAPQIVDFVASHTTGNIWVLTGKVIDESPGGLTVYLNGMGLNNAAVTVNSDGTFSYTVQLDPNADGIITAVTTDWFGLTSNTASASV